VTTAPTLQPTLWRTARVLANRTRLQIFSLLFQQPAQTVSEVAGHLKCSLPAASQYLRALEARGLLAVRRVGRRVEYRPTPPTAQGPASGLVDPLRLTFEQDPQPVETIFKLATGFTHPRRIDICIALKDQPRTLGQLQAATGISVKALARHLRKLHARGLVLRQQRGYALAPRPDALGRALLRLVRG
jgi:DNA-binding transcriptional ArsR family regulator